MGDQDFAGRARDDDPPRHTEKGVASPNVTTASTGDGRDTPYIVAMGGSAGGFEAFEQFFTHMPADTGLVFILVSHLEPTHKGMMPELLGRRTKMPVVEVEDGMKVESNHVYVIPPNADLAILHGELQVFKPVASRGQRMPIDFFFRHLAADQKDKAIGIIFSGMGSDGTLGVKAIKENFGVVMVQDPASAKYDSMPRSAINTGMADYVATAQELPARLIQHVTHAPATDEERALAEAEPPAPLQKLFVLLRIHGGNDFSCYKLNTIHRRLERRMHVHQFDRLPRYVRFLQQNPNEVELLYKELLIGVTNFFRDPGLFDFLKEKALPHLLQARAAGASLRVWNPGCSTGEETYSLAILLKECLQELKFQGGPPIQMFATDLDKDAIEKARRGTFPAGIAADVSPQRLANCFVHENDGYRIKKDIRDLVVFAPQNLLVDPPFTKVDILCCRNLLIYLNGETQKKLLTLMHYALNPGGLLILGTAESISGSDRLFSTLDKKWKVFQRKEVSERPRLALLSLSVPHPREDAVKPEQPGEPNMDMTYAAQRALLDWYGPPAVVVNSEGDILYLNGRTGKYLEPASGKVNSNVFAMAREGLREELGAALRTAAVRKTTVTTSGIRVKSNGDWSTITLTVKPLADAPVLLGRFLIVFQELVAAEADGRIVEKPPGADPTAAPTELEEELRHTRERLEATTEQMQATQEELRSANEELQSNNEELQSTNEELNSSKEELQSINEEMQTVNAELQMKIEELSQSNGDMKNLLNGIEIATIFLNADMSVKRFTALASRIVNLAAGDVGRPLSHFTTILKYDRLVQDAQKVLETLVPHESQVQTHEGHWYTMRILPYRTLDNVIDGVVMTFADITPIKQLEQLLLEQTAELQAARDYARNIIATIREPLVVLDGELRIVSASAAFYRAFQTSPAATTGRLLYDIGEREWDIPDLRRILGEILPRESQFADFRVEHDFPTVGHKVLLLNARQIVSGAGPATLILLAIEDVTKSAATVNQAKVQP